MNDKSEILTVQLTGKGKFIKSFVVHNMREVARVFRDLSIEIIRNENGKEIHGKTIRPVQKVL